MTPTELDLRWLAGLFDGDGTVNVNWTSRRPDVHVNLCQKNASESLEEVRGWFGGHPTRDNTSLSFSKAEQRVLLPAILPYLHLKYKQVGLGLWLLNRPKQSGKHLSREELNLRRNAANKITELCAVKEARGFELGELDLVWLAGFFDADGCISAPMIGASPNMLVTVFQKGSVILPEIQRRFGGKLDGRGNLRFRIAEANTLLRAIVPYLRFKQQRAKLALWLLNRPKYKGGRDKRVPNKEHVLRVRAADRIGELNY